MSEEDDFNQAVFVEALQARGAHTARTKSHPIKVRTPEEKAAQDAERQRKYEADQDEWMEKHMEALAKDTKKAESDLDRVTRMRSEFPDLRVERDRWEKIRYKAKSVNTRCNEVEIRRTCGCCSDAGILAMPYLKTTLGDVYSDPFRMEIGEGRTYTFLSEQKGWEERYRAIGIPEELVQQIRRWLDHELRVAAED